MLFLWLNFMVGSFLNAQVFGSVVSSGLHQHNYNIGCFSSVADEEGGQQKVTWRKYGMYICIYFLKQFFENVLVQQALLLGELISRDLYMYLSDTNQYVGLCQISIIRIRWLFVENILRDKRNCKVMPECEIDMFPLNCEMLFILKLENTFFLFLVFVESITYLHQHYHKYSSNGFDFIELLVDGSPSKFT